jgi:GNAT superfamily N-acetyltransferase
MDQAVEKLRIEQAAERDVPLILEFIRQLAEYERLADQVVATEDGLRKTLFGPRPSAEVIIGYAGQEPAGFALFFHNYSTFLGRPGLYLEDLFVLSKFRGRGYGRTLLTHLAAIAVERGCGRFEWSVLDWNEPAIVFYKKLGAMSMDQWTIFRLAGDALSRIGRGQEAGAR